MIEMLTEETLHGPKRIVKLLIRFRNLSVLGHGKLDNENLFKMINLYLFRDFTSSFHYHFDFLFCTTPLKFSSNYSHLFHDMWFP